MKDTAKFLESTRHVLPENRITIDDMLVHAYSVDASPYEPRAFAVLDVETPQELTALFAAAAETGISLTMRGSGTALSGQGNAEDVLVRLRGEGWRGIEILDEGRLAKARCCTRGAEINNALAPFGRCITADPATIATATIGAMAANNSAGLSCTVPNNIFHRMRDMEIILTDGTRLDTADESDVLRFRTTHAALLDELSAMRAGLLDDPGLADKVRRKYRIRNTCGYSLNAFTDCEDPVDILKHLMVGSEGTLGFIESITLETAAVTPLRATTMASFPSMESAMRAVLEMRAACEMYACEFFDDLTLRGLSVIPGFPEAFVPQGQASDDCALLLEIRTDTVEELSARSARIMDILSHYKLKFQPEFTRDPAECARLWGIRTALFPAIAGARKASEYAYTEDYCVPIENLPEACHAFADILKQLHFVGGVTGHALHGNLHCVIPIETGSEDDVHRLGEFIEKSAQTVLRLDGSLKGEHGTGRAVAPFVRLEWGDRLYGLMQRVKKTLDPAGILNRGVLLNEEPGSHLAGLKAISPAGMGLDFCVDCGFCEAVCPSAKIALSPRQRVYVLRAIAHMKQDGRQARAGEWEKSYRRMGIDLCATDGLCTTFCPLQVDVASAMRSLRHDALGEGAKHVSDFVGRHMRAATGCVSTLLDLAAATERVLGPALSAGLGRLSGRVAGMTLPDLNAVELCGGGRVPAPIQKGSAGRVVYFPSCAVRSMGYSGTTGRRVDPLMDVALRLLEKAGFEPVIPRQVETLCCGKAFETKGMFEAAEKAAARLSEALLEASGNGTLPVICDTSPCLARMRRTLDKRLILEEPVEFTLTRLVERLEFTRKHGRIAIHPTCSTRGMGLAGRMRELALLCADEVVVPEGISCCGFSGDKGFTRPELNASALASLARQVAGCEAGYSTSRTCEIGLSRHSGISYRNILYLVDECSLPKRRA